ncbi:MAG: hypothetical protein H0T12_02710 [Actinobacteria bacterium]|nr:hypothetical protein [Actinomycetota bacterium]
MRAALDEYRAAASGTHAWMLGRFVCPARRIAELHEGAARPRLSVILDEGWPGSLQRSPGAAIETLEAKVTGPEDVGPLLDAVEDVGLPRRPDVYLEPPPDGGLERLIPVLRQAGGGGPARVGAKLRCGGASPGDFPSPGRVAEFIALCRRNGVAFKATAGLHHPFRRADPATGIVRHGFVNLLAAAALDLSVDGLTEVIADKEPGSFRFTERALGWRHIEIGADALAAVRRGVFIAYGSCSFAEPVADLRGLGMLL